jgi:hypothetical protein
MHTVTNPKSIERIAAPLESGQKYRLHVIARNRESGQVALVSAATQVELKKIISGMNDHDVVTAFMGRELKVQEKKAVSLS